MIRTRFLYSAVFVLLLFIPDHAASSPLTFNRVALLNTSSHLAVLAKTNISSLTHAYTHTFSHSLADEYFVYRIPTSYPSRSLIGHIETNNPISRLSLMEMIQAGQRSVATRIETHGDGPLVFPRYEYSKRACRLSLTSTILDGHIAMTYSMLTELYWALWEVLVDTLKFFEAVFVLTGYDGFIVSGVSLKFAITPLAVS